MKPRAVTLVIYSLRLGGAERVLTFLANTLAAEGLSVRVMTFAPRHEPPFYALDPRVRLENLGLAREHSSREDPLVENCQPLVHIGGRRD